MQKASVCRTERKVRWTCNFGQRSAVARSDGGERGRGMASEISEAVVAGRSAPDLWPLQWAGGVLGHSVLQGAGGLLLLLLLVW